MNKRVVLMILDGWGIAKNPDVSAIDKAKTPFIDSCYEKYTHSTLEASGLFVGLPDGQMGNSEVGHMNLGAGRVVYQDLVKINKAIEEKTLAENEVLNQALSFAKKEDKKVHFIGLLSDGGVHAHINHLKGLCDITKKVGLDKVYIHAFTDGRDCDPNSGKSHLLDVEKHIEESPIKLASVIGRYYAMDRDNRWERVKLAYDLLVHGKGEKFCTSAEAIDSSYQNGITDEFVTPKVLTDSKGNPIAQIENGDVVICYNFRTDRGREISMALTQENFPEHQMEKLDLTYVTMTNYDDSFSGVNVLFNKDNLSNTLGEILAKHHKKQIRIAETEKYPHVTFFFSGGRETEFGGESRILIPSPKVATYDLKPEMSAFEIRDAIVEKLEAKEPDFVCLNFANPDMVGHTGDMSAAVKACETVDTCTQQVVETGLQNGYTFLVLADHGNSDCMINGDGSVNTAHTTQPVPCFLIDRDFQPAINKGKLGDVAPTILKLMGITQPEVMTGVSLF